MKCAREVQPRGAAYKSDIASKVGGAARNGKGRGAGGLIWVRPGGNEPPCLPGGGKLLLAHGWSDPAISARATIEYFNAVQQHTQEAASFTRLFLIPGVLHCGGGSGCDDVDFAGIISRWVEAGDAPSRITARKLDGAQVVRTHPLCAYPMKAQYNGTGSTDDAAAFTCR